MLDPGDVINTGTSQGVALRQLPYLTKGDTMRIGIDELGWQQQTLVG